MTEQLHVLLDGVRMGVLEREGQRVSFAYEAGYRDTRGAIPLSVAMPLAVRSHGHDVITPFLWGLLPDNVRILDAWGRRFHVSSGNPFALLRHVGEDCAGAVQFVTPERLDAVLAARDEENVQWITPRQVGQRLLGLSRDASVGRLPTDSGQFSLGGAQAKTALHKRGRRWGVPFGATPTTHILKPPIAELDGHCENEHLMLALARTVGLTAARSEVGHFGDAVAIVVQRYDRLPDPTGRVRRVHQEDLCQALAVMPTRKYQNEGGPSPADVVALLRRVSSDSGADVRAFVDALLFNWIIAGTDAHAKNYSLLLAAGGQVRLAPLYDLASALPYDQLDLRRLRLAMKMGGTYRLEHIDAGALGEFAAACDLDADAVRARAVELSDAVAAHTRAVVEQSGFDGPTVELLSKRLLKRARALSRETAAAG